MRRTILLLFKTTLTVLGINFIALPANAQEVESCYMINSTGAVVNLSQLCKNYQHLPPTTRQVFTAKIKRRYGGTPVIDVTFNNKQKFEMILDTGATQTTITEAMANHLGLVPVGSQIVQVASGEAVSLPIGRIESIEVGGAILRDTQVLVAPLPLLGQNFFSRYDLTIKQDVVEFHTR